ncbi:MAG TPA: hypothetical protein VFV75_06075 [Candidatus Polarisedimenticolaceae bacterium]|nr:hypothetical protein [Candidatus Polarisedimenticolaceae bacterium]
MRLSPAVSVLLASVLAPQTVAAPLFPIEVLLRNGDPVAGVGNVTTIDNLAVNAAGSWIVQVDTDNADTTVDTCLVKDGAVLLQENQALPPAPAAISSFDGVYLSGSGVFAGNIFLRNMPTNQDSGVYLGTNAIIPEGLVSSAPQFSPNTPYIGFFDAKVNASDQILVTASVDDPLIASTVDRAMVVASTFGGTLSGEHVVAKEGDLLPGQTETVADFGTGPHQSAFVGRDLVFYFADLNGDTLRDGVFYLDQRKIAQEGDPSPVSGRNYELLSSRSLDVNRFGETAFKANLDGDTASDEMIVSKGAELVREGGTLRDIDPFHFTAFGTTTGPIALDDVGNVLWFGDWDDPVTTVDTGLFLNNTLIVKEGDTLPGGGVLTAIASGDESFAMSEDGHYIVFEGTVTTDVARNAALRIEVTAPPPVPDGARVPGAQMTASRAANGVDIDLAWDAVSCPADDYNVFYGALADVATYTYSGAACDLGTTGTATFAAPAGDLFFLIVSQDGPIEGVHGFDGTGKAVPASAGGQCGATIQIRSDRCP